MVESLDQAEHQLRALQDLCPTLEKELLLEIIDTFNNFLSTDFDESDEDDETSQQQQQKDKKPSDLIVTSDISVIQGMLIAMGCDATLESTKSLYEKMKGQKLSSEVEEVKQSQESMQISTEQTAYTLTLSEYARMVNTFVEEECDPVDGLIETIQERYDPNATGQCKYSQILELMEKHQYMGGDEQAVKEVLAKYIIDKEAAGPLIDYTQAIKNLIQ